MHNGGAGMSEKLLSIILPAYNAEKTIKRAIVKKEIGIVNLLIQPTRHQMMDLFVYLIVLRVFQRTFQIMLLRNIQS